MRNLTTTLENILSLISCAEDYGFEDDVLFDAFGQMMGYKLSNEEIEIHARALEAQDGYGEEDYERVKYKLKEFKERYCEN